MIRLAAAAFLLASLAGCERETAAPEKTVRGDARAKAAEALAAALVGPVPEVDYARGLERQLRNSHAAWRGPACEPRAPACAAAAREVARESAARQAAAMRRRLVRLYAQRLAGQMSEAEMWAALDQLRAPGGAALARGLRSLLTIDPRLLNDMFMAMGTGSAEGSRGATDAFYDRTEGLPRRSDEGRVGPPAPPPPPPRR